MQNFTQRSLATTVGVVGATSALIGAGLSAAAPVSPLTVVPGPGVTGFASGCSYTLKVTVKNPGVTSKAALFYVAPPGGGSQFLGESSSRSPGANGTSVESTTWKPPAPGEWKLRAKHDGFLTPTVTINVVKGLDLGSLCGAAPF